MNSSGDQMLSFISQLYPICRSITGAGLRETLRMIKGEIPIELHEVPTGTKVFDWTVPREWKIRGAWIKNSAGERIVDFQRLNLHVVNYSSPVRGHMRLSELRSHLHTVHDHPDWVPYLTSYYNESWGFCLSENQLRKMREDEEYDVCIDSSLEDGHLTYGELLLPGKVTDEVLISCHVCHPSLANDNLSGIAVAVELARELANSARRYSYRFLFVPGTIGAITWLARNQTAAQRVSHGFVLTCVGDASHLTYKRSRRGNATVDRAFAHVLAHRGKSYEVIDFFPSGYDERQYCSPGFNLPVGCLMRGRHGEFPEYHTSGDNLDFVRAEALADSLSCAREVIDVLESDRVYLNQNPKCEPQFGRRGLVSEGLKQLAVLWILNLSDGQSSLLDIADRTKLPFAVIKNVAEVLLEADLLRLK